MTDLATAAPPAPRRGRLADLLRAAGVVPFLVFTAIFLLWPTVFIVLSAFRAGDGSLTFANIRALNTPGIRNAYLESIQLSAFSALAGCAIGFAIAAALVLGGLPRWLRQPVLTFSGVASNFAGVPLAFAFIATLGPLGLVTMALRDLGGINLRAYGFNLFSLTGLVLTYLFFQIPLMVLIIVPALDGLRREWREAAEVLGATGAQYWRMVALPILTPSLLGTFALLFANAFGAVATAFALAGPQFNLAPIKLFAQIRGDVLGNPGVGYALAFGMIVITGLTNAVYIWLRARTERWLK